MQPKGIINKWITNYAAKRLFGYGPSDDWSYVDNMQGPAKDIKLLGMYSGVAYRCINTIAEAVASQYVPYAYTLDSKGKKQTVAKHPFWDVLNSPNPDMTFYQLFEGSASFVEQFGEFFWYVVPGSKTGYANGIKEIYLLRPDKMGIVVDKSTGSVIGYNYSAGNGAKKIPFTPDEIRHFMTFNPKNAYRGFSTMEAAAEYIQTEEEVSRFTRNYFRNNAAMSGIISVEGKVPRESWNKFVRQWRERYQGVDNAGKVALVRDSQVKFTPIGSSVSEMQLTDLKQTTVEQILMMFRIPKGLFGMESDQGMGRASVETLEYIFAKWTIDNKLARFDDFIESICKKYYAKMPAMISHNNIIPDDKEYQLAYYNQGADRWITRQEIRDRDPELQNNDIKGANQLFTLINQIPLEDAGKAQAAASSSSDKSATVTLVKAKKKIVKDLEYSTNQKEVFRLQIEQNAKAYARQYKQSMIKVLEKQKSTVLGNIQHLAAPKKNLSDTLFNMSDEASSFNSEILPVISTLVLQQGQLAMEFAGDTTATYTLSQAIMNALAKQTKRMASNFNEDTITALSDSLTEGLQNGESIEEMSQRVSDVYDTAEGYRTERVARTESLGASNAATLDGYRQTGFVTAQQWYANPGACPFCEELDGETVGLDESYVNQGDSVSAHGHDGESMTMLADYSSIETPPLHPNCSCTIIPVTAADGGDA